MYSFISTFMCTVSMLLMPHHLSRTGEKMPFSQTTRRLGPIDLHPMSQSIPWPTVENLNEIHSLNTFQRIPRCSQ